MTAPPVRPASGAWTAGSHARPVAGEDVGIFRPVLALATGAGLLALFVASGHVRHLEAALSAVLARAAGISDARVVGSSVVFLVDGRLTGYGITLGCTVAFLVLPFSAATVGLLVIRRVPVTRSLCSLAAAVAIIVVFNQLRLLAIAGGMRLWGAELGYSRTHVLVGTLLSTVGVVLAGTAYLAVLLHGTSRHPGGSGG